MNASGTERYSAADLARRRARGETRTEAVMPRPKQLLSLRIDDDVVEWFRQQGPGYQTRINAALRAVMQHVRKRRV
jgi:uncharacterized protein (DUF4415 family)